MNNDPCMYHVSFLLNVGDRDEGGGRNRSGEVGSMWWMVSGIDGRDASKAQTVWTIAMCRRR